MRESGPIKSAGAVLQHEDTTTMVAFQRGLCLGADCRHDRCGLESQKRAQRCNYRGISCAAAAQPGSGASSEVGVSGLHCGGGACPPSLAACADMSLPMDSRSRAMMGSFIHFLQAVRGQREA